MLRIVIEFNPETHRVEKIDAPGFKNSGYLAAVLGIVVQQAEFEANLARAQQAQQEALQQAAQHQAVQQAIQQAANSERLNKNHFGRG